MTTGCQPLIAEALCWLVATELDLFVPPAAVHVAADDNDTSWLSKEISPVLHWNETEAADVDNIEALGGLIALDVLTLNHDRHAGNLIVEPYQAGLRLWGIDSGNALCGYPTDFSERRDELPDPAVLPIRGLTSTAAWRAVCGDALLNATVLQRLDRSQIERIVNEACVLGNEPKGDQLLEVLLHRQAAIVEFTQRYLLALEQADQ